MAKVLKLQLQNQFFQWILWLISFRIDWFDLLVVHGILKILLQHHSSKASILCRSAFCIVQLSYSYMTTWKTITVSKQTFVGLFFSTTVYVLHSSSSKVQMSFNFMAAISIQRDFGTQENEVCHCFYIFPNYLPRRDWTWCHNLSFLNAEFKPTFSLAFTFIKRLFGSSSLSAIIVVSSACLRLLIFLLAILIPVCDSSNLAFHMMCSAYKLNKQDDSTQLCLTLFPILNPSTDPCPVLTVASWPSYRFLTWHR